jgi:hypothetical protein
MGWTFYNSSGQQLRSTGTVLATQAEMEAGSVLTSFVTPGRTQYHPGVAKVWVKFEQSGAHSSSASHNMTSVTDGSAVGDTDLLYDTDMSGTEYALVACAAAVENIGAASLAATGATINVNDLAAGGVDSTICMVAVFGDQ